MRVIHNDRSTHIMIDWLVTHKDAILVWALLIGVVAFIIYFKWHDVHHYTEISSGNVKGGNAARDYAILRSRGFDVRLKTGMGAPRGQISTAGTYQNTQTLLVKRNQEARALAELARSHNDRR